MFILANKRVLLHAGSMYQYSWLRHLLTVFCLESFLLFLGYSCSPIVNTTCGPVEGFESDGVYNFYGIPYASPPVKKLRWRPPEALSPDKGNCWSGTLSAKKYGNTCYQISPDDHKSLIGSEDCLYLNVITPSLDVNAKKQVMVWIHGGSLQFSNGNWPLYSPTANLSRDTDVVYVGFNYRLHAFGFMALQALADDSPTKTSGNYGFMDMIAVLQWVQKNIRQFGGDPAKVNLLINHKRYYDCQVFIFNITAQGFFFFLMHKSLGQNIGNITSKVENLLV